MDHREGNSSPTMTSKQQDAYSHSTCIDKNDLNDDYKNLKLKPQMILSAETVNEWTLIYSDSNSSIFDSSSSNSSGEVHELSHELQNNTIKNDITNTDTNVSIIASFGSDSLTISKKPQIKLISSPDKKIDDDPIEYDQELENDKENLKNDQTSLYQSYSVETSSSIIVLDDDSDKQQHQVLVHNAGKDCMDSKKTTINTYTKANSINDGFVAIDSEAERSSIGSLACCDMKTTSSMTSNSTANSTTTSDFEDDEVFVHSVHILNDDHSNIEDVAKILPDQMSNSNFKQESQQKSSLMLSLPRNEMYKFKSHNRQRRRRQITNQQQQQRSGTRRRRRQEHQRSASSTSVLSPILFAPLLSSYDTQNAISSLKDDILVNSAEELGDTIDNEMFFDSQKLNNNDPNDLDDRESLVSLSLSLSSVLSVGTGTSLSRLREKYSKANNGNNTSDLLLPSKSELYGSLYRPEDIISGNNNNNEDNESDSHLLNQYDLPLMVEKTPRTRAYFHQPNTVLNNKLNLALIISLTAVIGLGIGNFLGWSTNLNQRQLSLAQVMKLKQLQDDLLVCMNNQQLNGGGSSTYDNKNYINKVCLNDADYWTERFRSLFDENRGLKELFQKTQKHFAENRLGAILGDDECTNKNTSDEFHNLKLDLLIKQMEHLKLLEVLENIKTKGEHSEKRLRVLEEENEDLKKKLEEEEQDDRVMAEDYNSRMARLEEQNQELRDAFRVDEMEDGQMIDELQSRISCLTKDNQQLRQLLNNLEKQILKDNESENPEDQEITATVKNLNVPRGDSHSETTNESMKRYNLVRQRVNQMMAENEELKSKIARYRWTDSRTSINDEIYSRTNNDQNMDNHEKSKMMEQIKIRLMIIHRQLLLSQNENKKLRQQYQHLLEQNKRLTLKLKQRKNEDFIRQQQQTSKLKRQFSVYEDNQDHFDASSSSNNDKNEKHGEQVWLRFIDQISLKYHQLSKKLHETLANSKHRSNLDAATSNLINYGKELIKSTMDRMHIISEQLLDGIGTKQKEKDYSGENDNKNYMFQYFSDLLTNVSINIEKSLQSTLNEVKSVIAPFSPSFTSNSGSIDNKNRKKEKKLKKFRKKLRKYDAQAAMLRKSIDDGDDEQKDWLMDRAESRENARLLKMRIDQFNDGVSYDWFSKRAKSREKSRKA